MGNPCALAAGCLLLLAGCPTVDLGDVPSEIGVCNPKGGFDYFRNTLWPMYLHPTASPARDCAKDGCHSNATPMRFDVTPDDMRNYKLAQSGMYLSCSQPQISLLFAKPTGLEVHSPGKLFEPDSATAKIFLDWFQ
jgi:hypothetical protein